LRSELAHHLGMFEPGRDKLVAEPRIRRAPVAIKCKRSDGQLIVRLTDLLLQERVVRRAPISGAATLKDST
jgi:hypothetical protein